MNDIRPLATTGAPSALAFPSEPLSLPVVAPPSHLASLVVARDALVVLGQSSSAIVAHEHRKTPFRHWPWPLIIGGVAAGFGAIISPFAAELIGAAGVGIAAAMGTALPVARHFVSSKLSDVGAITDTARLLPSSDGVATGDVVVAQRAAKLREQLRAKKVNNPELVVLCARLEAAGAGANPDQVEHAKRWLVVSDFCDAPTEELWDDNAKTTFDDLPLEERVIVAPLIATALRGVRTDWAWTAFQHVAPDLTPAFVIPAAGPVSTHGPDATLSAINALAEFCKAAGVEKHGAFYETREFPTMRAFAHSASADAMPDLERALVGMFAERVLAATKEHRKVAVDFRESLKQLVDLADAQPESAKAEAKRIARAVDNITNDAYIPENIFRPSKFESGNTVRQIAGSMELGLVRFNR